MILDENELAALSFNGVVSTCMDRICKYINATLLQDTIMPISLHSESDSAQGGGTTMHDC